MTLAGVPSQKFIQCGLAAIERGTVVLLGNRLFPPVG
jgi:hypothetical protein